MRGRKRNTLGKEREKIGVLRRDEDGHFLLQGIRDASTLRYSVPTPERVGMRERTST